MCLLGNVESCAYRFDAEEKNAIRADLEVENTYMISLIATPRMQVF